MILIAMSVALPARAQESVGVDCAQESLQEAIDTARRQGALSLELRAAMGLGRLLHRDGCTDQAQEVLAEVYDRFTEGRDSPGPVAARALLTEWGAAG